MTLYPGSRFVALIAALIASASLHAQDTKAFVATPDAGYYDFWEGTWYKVTNGKLDPSASFVVRRGEHPASFVETWRVRMDSTTTMRATALRTWDKIAGRWMYTWTSDNGLYQEWEGRKASGDWFMYRDFDVAGDRYHSRQGWIPHGVDSVTRLSEKSYDGQHWQVRFREEYVRVGRPEADGADRATVERLANDYLRAQRTNDGALMRSLFHPRAQVLFASGDTIGVLSAEAFAGRFTGVARPDGPEQFSIIETAVSKNAAFATVEMNGARGRVTDYLTLMKTAGRWVIVSKATAFVPSGAPPG